MMKPFRGITVFNDLQCYNLTLMIPFDTNLGNIRNSAKKKIINYHRVLIIGH